VAAGELEASRVRVGELELVAERLSDLVVAREGELREARAQLEKERVWGEGAMRSLVVLAAALERVGGSVEMARHDGLPAAGAAQAADAEDALADSALPAVAGAGPGEAPPRVAEDVFVGSVELEVGPLSDFAQLVGFEDAAGGIDATREIVVKRFAGGRATLEMSLSEPVELLRELEERAPFEFKVRDTRADRVILDLEEE